MAEKITLFLTLTLVGLLSIAGTATATELPIPPRMQETPVWCWVAVGQMTFEFFGVPNVNPAGDYQCGVIGLLAAGTIREDCAYRCENCVVPAGSKDGVIRMIEDYPARVAYVGDEDVPRLTVRYRARPLDEDTLMEAIDRETPVIAGISPSGRPGPWATSQHVALIVGYDSDDEGDVQLLVNDPFPFAGANPYIQAGGDANGDGSYWISYRAFRARLDWAESFVVAQSGTIRATPKGDFCCFVSPFGADSCPLNLSGRLPLGAQCTCTYPPSARFFGRVCSPF